MRYELLNSQQSRNLTNSIVGKVYFSTRCKARREIERFEDDFPAPTGDEPRSSSIAFFGGKCIYSEAPGLVVEEEQDLYE
jgi:hypothetical protein